MSHDASCPAAVHAEGGRQPVLDGVRAISILSVLWIHLFPLRVAGHSLNDSLGMFGMALFFILSGYLITQQLLKRPPVGNFIARRLLRVVPAAWICMVVVWCFVPVDVETALSYLFFYANLPPQRLVWPIDHFWSLCIEVQFYLLAAVLLWLRVRAIGWLFPALLLAVTVMRVTHLSTTGSITWFRADDLLAGACLALLMQSRHAPLARALLGRPAVIPLALLMLLACSLISHHSVYPLSFLRPYAAAVFVCALMVQPGIGCRAGWGEPHLPILLLFPTPCMCGTCPWRPPGSAAVSTGLNTSNDRCCCWWSSATRTYPPSRWNGASTRWPSALGQGAAGS